MSSIKAELALYRAKARMADRRLAHKLNILAARLVVAAGLGLVAMVCAG